LSKAILVVSHGSSYKDTREKCIDSVEKSIKDFFPEDIVRRAFSSDRIIANLKERDGICIDTVTEALDKLLSEGIKEVFVQPLLIIPGYEYDKLRNIIGGYEEKGFTTLKLGKPLLYDMKDYPQVVKALENQIQDIKQSDRVMMMAHGTDHCSNGLYMCLQHFLDKENVNITIGNIKGYPEIMDIIPRLEHMKVRSVSLIPFMLVAGDHARKDMAGNAEDSWVNVLSKNGYKVDYEIRGLGENKMVHRIFVNKIKELIQEAR